MELTLNRLNDDGKSTMGELDLSPFKFHSLEPPWRNNHEWDGDFDHVSCIPVGRYRVDFKPLPIDSRMWNLFHKEYLALPLLVDVPGRSGIYLHPMNFIHDTHGCLGIGLLAGSDTITQSKKAFGYLLPIIEKSVNIDPDGLWLTIKNQFQPPISAPK